MRYTPQTLGGELSPVDGELEKISEAIKDTLSRKGDTPNAMTSDIDMNYYRVINLPTPKNDNEPARLKDIQVKAGLPSVTGNQGKYLRVDGDTFQWSTAVSSFNNRTGKVVPQKGDYEATDIISKGGTVQQDLLNIDFRVKAVESTYNNNNWDTAYSWGDHATVGYALSVNLADVATSGLATDVSYNTTTVSAALDSKFDSTTGKADTSTAEAGTDDTQWMSPLNSLQQVQQFGLGVYKAKVLPVRNVDDPSNPSGLFRVDGSDTGTKPWGSVGASLVNCYVTGSFNTDGPGQLAWTDTNAYFRLSNANPWREIYSTGNLLGTVSQSAGEPTGSVIESGSNVNGEYIKFADGTMICSREKTYTPVTVSTTNYTILEGPGGQVDPSDLSYPAQFVSAPYASAAYYGGHAGEIVPTLESVSSNGWGGFLFLVKLLGADRTVTPTVRFFAKGRWY